MAFFGNDAVNRVNLHYGAQALAAAAGGIFYLAYLLRAGISVPASLTIFAATLAGRFAFRPATLPLAKLWGLRPLVILGSLVVAGEYLLLGQVKGLDLWLLALVIVSSVGEATYWPAYHAYFAQVGDAEHRGQQIGAREALATLAGIVGPVIGAWAILTFGGGWAFGAVACIQAASALPLIGAPDVPVRPSAPGAWAAARSGMTLFLVDGWMAACWYLIWQVVLFVSLGRSLEAYGGAMALAALVGAVIGLLFGRHIDRGHGRRATVIAYLVTAGVTVLRAASLGSPWLAVGANAAGALVAALVLPAMMTAVYNLAKASPCAFRFHLASDGGWDVGCAAGLLFAAALSAVGASLALAILLALPGAVVATLILWRYYGEQGVVGDVEVEARVIAEPP
jgi:DHA1 family inner membrane transport protein